ncbi:hypothetical protein [Agrococcus beijingensis]|uniref:hypothetical protein n=1 Tax=Agrococcus beijingensis TaxID=3068634 RepID=UPI002740CDAB|nr:hypothetical protein [Agrococcus sp. REN33]
MSDQWLPEGPGPEPMDDAFKARMRQGLSSMAVRERLRERRRNRAIAGGALAAVVVATVAVIGAQALGGGQLEQDRAQPGTTQTPAPATSSTPAPTEPSTPAPTEPSTPAPSEPGPAPATPPAGFEVVAAGEPRVLDVQSCADGCGDAGTGGGSPVERTFDVYLLCEGSGSVAYGGQSWVDCSEHPAGSAFVQLDAIDTVDDGDPQFTTSTDFDGQLRVVEPGRLPAGDAGGSTATVFVTCQGTRGTVRVAGVVFDCAAAEAAPGMVVRSSTIAAWGVPIEAGALAPRIEPDPDASVQVAYVVER